MTRDEKLALLRTWDACHGELDAQWSALAELTEAGPESPLGSAIWDTFAEYTKSLGLLLGDPFGSLEWFWLENQMGGRGHVAGVEGDMREINTVEDLLWLIDVTA